MKIFANIVHSISYGISFLGWGSVIIMGLVTITAICLRLLHVSSSGAFELVVLMGTVTFVSAWAYTEIQNKHIHVDILVSRLPQRAQFIIRSITYFFSLGACCLASYYSFVNAYKMQQNNQVMAVLFPVPSCIPTYITSTMLFLLSLVILIKLVDNITRSLKK